MHYCYSFVAVGRKTYRNFASTNCTVRRQNAFENPRLRLAQKNFRCPRVSAKWDPMYKTQNKHHWDEYSCDPWDDWRRPPPYNMENCWEYPTNHIRWFGLPKMSEKCVPRLLAEDQKQTVLPCTKHFCHDIEQRGTISWGTLSPVMRRGCIITSRSLRRQVWSGENLEKHWHIFIFTCNSCKCIKRRGKKGFPPRSVYL